MASDGLANPTTCVVVHVEDVARIERWAAAQQANLRLLQRELTAARADAVAKLAALDGQIDATSPTTPAAPAAKADLESQLQAVLDAQARRLEAEVRAVETEAAARVAEAVREASQLLADLAQPSSAPVPVDEAAQGCEDGPEEHQVVDLTRPHLLNSSTFTDFWGGLPEVGPVRGRLRRLLQWQGQ